MGRYFGREPRYSQEEAEAQAKQAIDAAVNKGRPPEEDWKALGSRMGEINRALAARPPVDIVPPPPPRRVEAEDGNARRPRAVNQILRPRPAPAPEPTPHAPRGAAGAPAKRAAKASASGPAKPAKRSARTTEQRNPAPPKRPVAKKRPD